MLNQVMHPYNDTLQGPCCDCRSMSISIATINTIKYKENLEVARKTILAKTGLKCYSNWSAIWINDDEAILIAATLNAYRSFPQ